MQTWMEAYARAPGANGDDHGGIDAAIEAAIASAASSLRDLIEGDRHVESFDVAGRR